MNYDKIKLIKAEFDGIVAIHEISDEENYGYSEIYRCMVVKQKSVGPPCRFMVLGANNWEIKKPE